MGYIYILTGVVLIITTLYLFTRLSKPKIHKSVGFEGCKEVITKDDKDPYSQAVWAAFNSGNVTYYNSGDTHMTQTDSKTGKTIKVKLEE